MLYHETEMMDLYEKGAFRKGDGKLTDRSPTTPSAGTPTTSKEDSPSTGPSGSSWTWETAPPAAPSPSTRGWASTVG
jgi:hypothetical protein